MGTLLDTNVLMLTAQKKINIYALDGPFTLDACMKELEHIAKKNRAAKLALDIAKEKGIKIIKTPAVSADTAIISYAKKEQCRVATNDIELIKKLKKFGIIVLRLRQGKYFVEE